MSPGGLTSSALENAPLTLAPPICWTCLLVRPTDQGTTMMDLGLSRQPAFPEETREKMTSVAFLTPSRERSRAKMQIVGKQQLGMT